MDHWITEHWSADEQRWVRIDAEIAGLDLDLADHPEDLGPEEFLTAGEAWVRYRADAVDPAAACVAGDTDAIEGLHASMPIPEELLARL